MKKLKFIAMGLLAAVSALSFMSRNNFNPDGADFFVDDEGMVSVKDFKEFVNTGLVVPIVTCYSEAFPHAFMTKCYSDIKFEFNNEYMGTSEDQLLYANNEVGGDVVFNNCGNREHICAVKANYSTKEINVQESFLSEWISKDDYLEKFCAGMKKQKGE